jgi:ankyrin repeat protein
MTAKYLIDSGAKFNLRDDRGFTPLALAISTISQEGRQIQKHLITAGAKEDLQTACLDGNVTKVFDFLKNNPVIPNSKPDHNTLLSSCYNGGYANVHDRAKILEALFAHGLSPEKSEIVTFVNSFTGGDMASSDPFAAVLMKHID